MSILVTGGAGFIGANFIVHWLRAAEEPVVNLDKLTYAGNLASLQAVNGDSRYHFYRADICDRDTVLDVLQRHDVRGIVHLAAETHVDRSIHGPEAFVRSNVSGTLSLLQAARTHWESMSAVRRSAFRLINVSTDEVYGSLRPGDPAFSEASTYRPNSPYSASKAGADHLARAFFHTYGLPVITTNCSNNYGPRQFPEKFIPVMILNGLRGDRLPVYGDGANVRDWLYVEDHCEALRQVLAHGEPGQTYNIGGGGERANTDVAESVCRLLDDMLPESPHRPHEQLIEFVSDRPGHDRRYAIDATKVHDHIGWHPRESFESGLKKTVAWYLANESWVRNVTSGEYRDWVNLNYRARAGRT